MKPPVRLFEGDRGFVGHLVRASEENRREFHFYSIDLAGANEDKLPALVGVAEKSYLRILVEHLLHEKQCLLLDAVGGISRDADLLRGRGAVYECDEERELNFHPT